MHNQGEGKTVLVTGGSRGIGRGIALVLARHGYDLMISHLGDDENADEVADYIRKTYGRRCEQISIDLREPEAPEQLVGYAVSVLGRIDVAVNNAAVTLFGYIQDMDAQDMNTLFRLNFMAPLLVIQAVAKHMIDNNIEGNIINIASTRAERAYPSDAVYGGLKAGLKRATESIALELAPNRIRVNAIAPGAIETMPNKEDFYQELAKKVPLERIGHPEDIGQAALWLCSEQASYITGTTLRIDGGLILPGMPENGPGTGEFGWGRPNRNGK